jgi:hypothetical protein
MITNRPWEFSPKNEVGEEASICLMDVVIPRNRMSDCYAIMLKMFNCRSNHAL